MRLVFLFVLLFIGHTDAFQSISGENLVSFKSLCSSSICFFLIFAILFFTNQWMSPVAWSLFSVSLRKNCGNDAECICMWWCIVWVGSSSHNLSAPKFPSRKK